MNTAAVCQNPVPLIYAMLLAGAAGGIATAAMEAVLLRLRKTPRGRWVARLLSLAVAAVIMATLAPALAAGATLQAFELSEHRPANKARNHGAPTAQHEPPGQRQSVNRASQPLLSLHAAAHAGGGVIAAQPDAVVAGSRVVAAYGCPCITRGSAIAESVANAEQRTGQHQGENQPPASGALAQRAEADAEYSQHYPTPSTHHVHRHPFDARLPLSIAQGGAA